MLPREYYFNTEDSLKCKNILWEILKQVRRRETSFLGPMRWRHVNIGNIRVLEDQIRRALDFSEEMNQKGYFNFFMSMEHLRHTDSDEHCDMKGKYDKQRYGFDLFFDIDGVGNNIRTKVNNAHARAMKVYRFFQRVDAPFAIRFSASKGFHLMLEWEDLSEYMQPSDYGTINKDMTAFINSETGANLDTSVATKRSDLIRVAYSMHPSGYICLPLTDAQFEKFHVDMATPEKVYGLWLYKRGNLKRDGDISELMDKFNLFKRGG